MYGTRIDDIDNDTIGKMQHTTNVMFGEHSYNEYAGIKCAMNKCYI